MGVVVRDGVLPLPGQIWEASQEGEADCIHSGGSGGAATVVCGQAEGSKLGDLGYLGEGSTRQAPSALTPSWEGGGSPRFPAYGGI